MLNSFLDYYVNVTNTGIYFEYTDIVNEIVDKYDLKTNIPNDGKASDLLKFLVNCNDITTEIEENINKVAIIEKETRQLKEKTIKSKKRITEIDNNINQITLKETTTTNNLLNNLQRNFKEIETVLRNYNKELSFYETEISTIETNLIEIQKNIGQNNKELEEIKKDLELKNIAYKLILKGNFDNISLVVNLKYAIDYLEKEIEHKNSIIKNWEQKKQVEVNKKYELLNKKYNVQRLIFETKEKINKTKLIIENKLTEIVEKEAYNKNKTIEIDNLQKEKDNLLKEVTEMLARHSQNIPKVKSLHTEYDLLILKYLDIFTKFNIYSDDIIDVETYWIEAKSVFQSIETLLAPFGFSNIQYKFHNMNYVDGIKFKDYSNNQKIVVNPKFFAYLEYFSNIKEQYDNYLETLIELEYNSLDAKEIADNIKEISECIIDLIGNANMPYTLGALGLYSNNKDFNINTIHNNKTFCNNIINKVKNGSIQRAKQNRTNSIKIQNVYADVTNILQNK